MGWTEETDWQDSQGKTMRPPARRWYRYYFQERWWHRYTRYQVVMESPFHTIETSVNGDSNGHRAVLADPDFTIKDREVVPWMRQYVKTGKACFEFNVSYELMSGQQSTMMMTARFSDKKTALLFKLSFG